MNLSKHFTLYELTASQYAARKGLDNTPSRSVIANLERICTDYLEPLRAILKAPIMISSGYRSPAVNKGIGGSMGSAHMLGLAVDIVVPSMRVESVCFHAASLAIKFDQIIDEFGSWTHLAIPQKTINPRNQQFRARRVNGVVVYSPVNFNRADI